ncbi:dTDP-6-deoxy-L-hexose 3-O-methyltransferase [Salmonella enterica]|uniref:dTDP-6-deoxy-L-hexose 3-O-methyltransferase n=5 Tax=Enterobacteriaceae TaxID=543 RepID=UPI00300FD94C
MTTITKERLLTIKQWRETYGPGSNVVLPAEEAEELARIALASLEAKPIGAFHIAEQQVDGTSDYLKDGEWPIDNGIIEVYAAPPVPVVPEEKPMPNPLSMYAVDAVAAIAEVRGWNACRAAMLQSGNFRENKNSSTNNFREIAETSTNYPVIPSEVLSAILKVAKIRADFDDFDGDRRGIGDCLDEAEQELIVTINKYASQLAAEPIATNDVREQTAVPPIQADVAQAIENLKQKLVECNRYNYCADAVKGVEDACRAVSYSQADNQPASGNQAAESNRDNEWTGNPDIDNAIIMLDRIDTLENCDDDRIEAVKAVLRRLAGNSPVTPDSSVPAPGKGVTGERIRIKPHVYRELVNRLHDTAIKCAGTQQLRERISRVLGDVITPDHHKQAEKSGLERCHLEAALNIKPGHTLGIIDALLVHKMARALLPLVDAGDTSEGEV